MKPHAGKATGSLLDYEIPGSGDVTPLFHMTGLSHPGAGSPVRVQSGRVHAVTPEPQHREREDSPSASGASQFGCRFRGRHGFLTAAFVRRPARLVRPLDPPV